MSEHRNGAVYFKGKWFIKSKLQRWNKKGAEVGNPGLVPHQGAGDALALGTWSGTQESFSGAQVGKECIEFLFAIFSKMRLWWHCSSHGQTCLGLLVLFFESCVTCPNWQQDAAWFSSEHWPGKWETKACAVLGHCLAFWDMLPGLLVKTLLICIIYQTWEGVESKMQ